MGMGDDARPVRVFRHAARTNRTLARNAWHAEAAAHALRIHRANAVYSFIPKNGCTTMRLSIALANGCIASPDDIQWIHRNTATFIASLAELATADYTFAILRCPFARLASCYLDKIVGRYPPFWTLVEGTGGWIAPEAFTFRRFVEALDEPGVRALDQHWRPQCDLLVYEDYDDLFDLADFPAAARRLKERIGLDVVDARQLSGHGTDGLRRVSTMGPDTPPLDILVARANGEVPDPTALFDPAIVETVRRLYAEDIALVASRFPDTLMF